MRRYAFFVLRYERASSSDFPIVCLWHDLYKQKTIEERIRAFARAALPRLTYEKASDLSGPNVPLVDVAAHRKTSLTLDLNWLFSAMKGGIERSSSEEIMCAIKGLNGLLKNRRFGELNLIIGMVPPQKLSPELMLTFARITFPVRDFLSNWFPFVRKIKHELDRRELDSKKLLKGLI